MQYKDDFDDGPDFKAAIASIFGALGKRERVEPRGPFWSVAIVLTLVLFLGSVLWYSYPREAEKRETLAVPIIRADASPYKVVPNDPGGMDIPHRDSTVFDTLQASNDRKIENLLPESEEPVSREQLFAGLKTRVTVQGKEVVSVAEEPVAIEAPAVDITETVEVAEAQPEASQVVIAEEKDVAEESIVVASVPAPTKKPQDDTAKAIEYSRTEPAAGVETFESKESGKHFVQFASLRSEGDAQNSWKDLQKSLAFLRPLPHRVERADLGARGVYYRLQAGPFEEAKARSICAQVESQRPGGCLVIKD